MYEDLIGKPFEWGARGPDAYDCFGLCAEIYRRLGRRLPDINSPPGRSAGDVDDRVRVERPRFERIAGPQAFCLVAFKMRPPFVSHIGVVLEDGRRFISAGRRHNVYVQKLDHWWRQRAEGFYVF